MQKWTQDEAIAYECAREAITHLRAIINHEMEEESLKLSPDRQKLANLQDEHTRLFYERAALGVKDSEKIALIRKEYGSRIRKWNENHQ